MNLKSKNQSSFYGIFGVFIAALFLLTNTNIVLASDLSAGGWTRKAEIVLDQTSANLTGFPILLSQANLPSEMFDADGAHPALSGGGDIRFSSDANGANQLPCEIVTFTIDNNPVNGTAEIWVKTNLSSSATTSIWVWYGKTGEVQPDVAGTYGRNNVWSNGFMLVQHMKGAAYSALIDSTGRGHNVSAQGANAPSYNQSSKIGYGVNYSDAYNDIPNHADFNLSALTISCWAKRTSTITLQGFAGKLTWATNWSGYSLFTYNGDYLARYVIGKGDANPSTIVADAGNIVGSTFVNLIGRTDASNHSNLFYNGVKQANYADSAISNNSGVFSIGRELNNATNSNITGGVDEVQLSNVARSDEWIATQYSNQNDPASFALAGTPQDILLDLNEDTNYLKDRRVIAYDENKEGAIVLSGRYGGTAPSHVEVRVFNRTTNTTVQVSGNDWNTLSGETISGNSWSGTLSHIPKTNAWLGFEVRNSDNHNVIFTGTHKIGVGFVIIYFGQSYIDKWLDYDDPAYVKRTSSDLVSKFRHATTGQIGEQSTQDPADVFPYTGWALNTGNGSITFANKLQSELHCPIGVLDYGIGGSALLEAYKGALGYWLGASASNNWYEDLQEGLLVSEPMSRKKVNGALWYQGWTDSMNNITYQVYYDGMVTLFGNLETDTNYSNLPIYIVAQPKSSNSAYLGHDASFSAVRSAQEDICNNNHEVKRIFAGQSVDLPLLADGVHLTYQSQETEALRYAQSVLWHEIGTGNYAYHRGPKNIWWHNVDSTHTDVYIQHDGGTDFTPASSIDSYEVYNGSSWIAATGVRQNATTVRLNYASGTISGVRCLYGESPITSYTLKDDAALALPIEADESIPSTSPLNFTLTYSAGANGSITGTSPQTVSYGSDGTAVTAVPEAHYHFVQWSDGSTSNPRTDTNVTGDISVTASFAIDTHTVTFNKNTGGTEADPTTKTADYGGNVGTLPTPPTKTGYSFAGWNTQADGNGSLFDATTAVTDNITVYAIWTINNFTVTFNKNGGDTEASPTTKTADYNTTINALPTAPTRTGYSFGSWNTQANGSGTAFTGSTNVTNNITVYAQWAANEFTLTYSAGANGSITGTSPQTVNYGASGTAVTAVPDTGYGFVNWSDSSTQNPRTDTNVAANISVTANFEVAPNISAVDAGSGTDTDRASLTSNTWFKYSDTGSDDQVSFSWTDPASISDDTFYYELNSTATATISGDELNTANAYVDNITISEGTNYFHVRPKTGAGTWGIERTFIVKYDKTAPTGLTLDWGTIALGSIQVTPSGASDSGSGLPTDKYYIELDQNATSFVTADANSGWVSGASTFSTLNASEAQAIRVKVKDNVGNESAWVTPTPAYKYTLANAATTASHTNQTTTALRLTWASGGAQKDYAYGTTNSCVDGTTSNGYLDLSTLSANTQYTRYVCARNGDDTKTASLTLQAYTAASTPAAPTVNNPTTTTLAVNPVTGGTETSLAIYAEQGATCDGAGGLGYVQADGSISASAVWQADAAWSTVTVTGLSANTQYSFCAKAKNADDDETAFGLAGSGTTSTTADSTPPVISAVAASVNSSGATITWTTDEAASTQIEYGLSTSFGVTTSVINTAPRVTAHSQSIGSLLACTKYYFRVKSVDAGSNPASGDTSNFTTTGCTGSASVSGENDDTIPLATGGSVTLSSGSANLAITMPVDYSVSEASFQVKQLASAATIATTSTPASKSLVGSHTYSLDAYTDTTTKITTFDNPITVTLNYTDSEIVGLDESSLWIYRYSDGAWTALSNCIVNTAANSITCETSHFSTFGLFGSAASSGSSSSSGGGGSGSGIFCSAQEFSFVNPKPDIVVTTLPEISFVVDADYPVNGISVKVNDQPIEIKITKQANGDYLVEANTSKLKLPEGIVKINLLAQKYASCKREELYLITLSKTRGKSPTTLFPDVEADSWFADFVKELTLAKIISGFPDGNFKPANLVTRAESSKIIAKAFNLDADTNTSQPFNDTPSGEWFTPFVASLDQSGLLTGFVEIRQVSDFGRKLVIGHKGADVLELKKILQELGYLKNFSTNYFDQTTQQAVITFQYDHLKTYLRDGLGVVGSVTAAKLFELAGHGIMSGKYFHPAQTLTRAEALKLLLTASKIPLLEKITKSSFADVSANDSLAVYVETALAKGIVQKADHFYPSQPINRAELAKLVSKTINSD